MSTVAHVASYRGSWVCLQIPKELISGKSLKLKPNSTEHIGSRSIQGCRLDDGTFIFESGCNQEVGPSVQPFEINCPRKTLSFEKPVKRYCVTKQNGNLRATLVVRNEKVKFHLSLGSERVLTEKSHIATLKKDDFGLDFCVGTNDNHEQIMTFAGWTDHIYILINDDSDLDYSALRKTSPFKIIERSNLYRIFG